MALRTPLLQMLANVYGHIGYQLNPIELYNLPSLLRLALNLGIDTYLIWLILERDAFSVGLLISIMQSSKPFFSLMLRIFIQYGNITLNVLHMLYFALYGRRIFLLLDSPCFYGVLHSLTEAKRIFFWGVAFNSAFFLLLNVGNLIQLFRVKFTLQTVITIVCLYILATMFNFGVYLLAYQQFATKRVLTKLEASFDSKQCDLTQLLTSLQSVASVNQSLHQLLSFSFLVFIMVSVESFIVTGCFFTFLFSFNNLSMLLYFIHPLECWIMLTYLTANNRRVVSHFECLCRRLAESHQQQQMRQQHGTLNSGAVMQSLWSGKKFIGHTRNNNNKYKNNLSKSGHLRLYELLMFKPCFEMRLFDDMVTVNLSFTLAAALFSLHLVTFLVQTN